MREKILILGASSRAASRFLEQLNSSNLFEFLTPSSKELDIRNYEILESFIKQYLPSVIINFAAVTDLNICEKERDQKDGIVWQINVLGVKNLVKLCNQHNLHLVQISTASVFAGRKNDPGPYSEDHPPEKYFDYLSWYGITKVIAEDIVKKTEKYTILRLSSAARGTPKTKPDLLWRIIKAYKEKNLPHMFSNQYLTITDLTEVASALSQIILKRHYGVLHIASSDLSTPYEIAAYLLNKISNKRCVISPITLEKFIEKNPYPFVRRFYPQYWGLSTEKTQLQLGLRFKTWREVIDDFINCDLDL